MTTAFSRQLCDLLVAGGVRAAFGVPGGQTVPYYQALEESAIQHVLMRDERSAACAADAYARMTNTVGVCDATVGPGTTNLISGLAEAYASSSPVLALVADIPRHYEHLRRRGAASQALDQRALLAPVTKWIGRVGRPDALVPVVRQAVRVATSGRPGPVAVELPDDLLRDSELPELPPLPAELEPFAYPRFRSRPADADLERAADLLAGAERPLILAGGGALISRAGPDVERLAARLAIPVATTLGGKGTVDERSEWAVGVTGIFGTAWAGEALSAADVVLVFGSRMGQFGTHTWTSPGGHQAVVHVDIDGEELGRTGPIRLGICADVRETVRALAEAMPAREPGARSWAEPLRVATEQPPEAPDGRIRPHELVRVVDDVLGVGDVLLCDASLASGWGSQYYEAKRPGRSFLAPRGLAGTGWSGGAAIGARLGAEPEQRLVVLAGDGSWGYGMAEIETAVRIGASVVYVILNNAGLGWIKLIHGELSRSSRYGDVDFAAAARAAGAAGVRIANLDDLRAELERGLGRPGPTLIDALTNIEDTPVQRPAGAARPQGAYA